MFVCDTNSFTTMYNRNFWFEGIIKFVFCVLDYSFWIYKIQFFFFLQKKKLLLTTVKLEENPVCSFECLLKSVSVFTSGTLLAPSLLIFPNFECSNNTLSIRIEKVHIIVNFMLQIALSIMSVCMLCTHKKK
jgi:hypothetical protein